ncbi:conserved membrane hypothetical protein [Sphingomonas sp. T1]|nr:conserved membrane hypothetical protein [Sphingomonas sp. T1]
MPVSFFYPLFYLRLRDVSGVHIVRRDIIAMFVVTAILCTPFILLPQANYFLKDGFLDKVATFSAVLIGFYVAALIAIATLSSSFADLDRIITSGVIRKPPVDGVKGDKLTRREYVCYMFGYMAFVSLLLTLLIMTITSISPIMKPFYVTFCGFGYYSSWSSGWLRGFAIILTMIPISSLSVTTVRGLYYLVERLYDVEPVVNQNRDLNG